ncbi:hypothetical protein BT63DRAFT_457047 [Microthyrium microscopicum]|uniref:Uncharacterized protein n=1 Tax=Microthyrium microscopicum TaxID=703497 RepID=A0A6A6U631_9PEZI|nr:hypothetical protein BT63DRAFT_457047 [Microthyrium microscopicum]
MKYTAVIIASLGMASAAMFEKRAVDPAQATASLFAALPSSLQALALTNQPSAAAVISSELSGGSAPAWFSSLPAEVQTYFITQGAAATAGASAAASVGASASSAIASITKGASSAIASATSGAAKSATASGSGSAASSSSSGSGAAPTGVIGAGIAGAIGLVGMLAL